MGINLKGRSVLTLMDFSQEEIRYLLDLGHDLKSQKRMGVRQGVLKGKNVMLMFEKASTRTRSAFEVACFDEGAHVTFMDIKMSQMLTKESAEDTAKVLGRFYDGIEYRGYKQKVVEELAMFSGVPIYNGLTDDDHPTQVLADLMTIEEHVAKPLNKVKVVFAGDVKNNVSIAWMYGASKMGMHYVGYGPEEIIAQIPEEIIEKINSACDYSGGKVELTSDPKCLHGADIIYTDVWASMGEEDQIPEKVKLLTPYKITMKMLKDTENPDIVFLHCLPAFHDFETRMARDQMDKGYDIREVEDEVFRSRYSKVFDQSENKMHSIKAVMVATIA